MSKKTIGILANFIIPGLGSLILGKVIQGILQLILWVIGAAITWSVLFAFVGLFFMGAAWIWGIITAATYVDAKEAAAQSGVKFGK